MAKENSSITIKEVAQLAGVSVATAGRAMGNYGRISDKTKQKVLAAAQELNYVPNQVAQSMRNQNTKTLAVVVPDIQNNFFGTIVAAMEQRARSKGYSMVICNTNERRDLELECLETIASKQVDGILLASTFVDREEIPPKYIKTVLDKYPVVAFDRKIKGFPFTTILSDNYNMCYQVTKYLIGQGHEYIAAIGSEKDKIVSNTTKDRKKGYMAALREAGIAQNERYIDVDWMKPAELAKRIDILFDYHKVTAAIILNNSLTGGFLKSMKRRAMRIPDDLSLIIWDDEIYDEVLDITAVQQPGQRMGELAVDNLIEQIENPTLEIPDVNGLNITLNGQMIKRGSCKIQRNF